MGFWDNISGVKQNNSGFNLQEFIKFYNENKNKDMNQTIQNMLSSGQVSQEQLNQATKKAQDIMQMLKNIGMLK